MVFKENFINHPPCFGLGVGFINQDPTLQFDWYLTLHRSRFDGITQVGTCFFRFPCVENCMIVVFRVQNFADVLDVTLECSQRVRCKRKCSEGSTKSVLDV